MVWRRRERVQGGTPTLDGFQFPPTRADSFGGFGGADGLVFAAGCAALAEEFKDGGFEGPSGVGGLVARQASEST
jgi:hypothetical protein